MSYWQRASFKPMWASRFTIVLMLTGLRLPSGGRPSPRAGLNLRVRVRGSNRNLLWLKRTFRMRCAYLQISEMRWSGRLLWSRSSTKKRFVTFFSWA